MKFYIATKLENYEAARCLSDKLKSFGWIHTYDWTVHGSVKEDGIALLTEIGQKEYEGVKDAEVVIILTPQGRGTHVELGMAIAFNKKIYICHTDDSYFKSDDNTSTFYWLPQVRRLVGTVDDITSELLRINA